MKIELLLPYLFYTSILLAAINIYFQVAGHFNIIDKPNDRSSHSRLVLRGGGIIFSTGIILWFINAFNFMDGINGITAGYSLSALAGLWIVNNYQAPFVSNDLLYAATLAVAIFGFYNFRTRARCFAGDVGAVSISFILVFLTGKLILATGNPLYLMFMIVYGVDTFLTILYRLTRHENIFAAHRSHLYQYLANESGISHVKVSTGYTVAQLLINLLIIVLAGQVALGYQLVVSVGITGGLAAVYVIVKGD